MFVIVNGPVGVGDLDLDVEGILQLAGKGFSFVELLSTCPTNWGLAPADAMKRMREEVAAYYPLGVYREAEV